MSVPRTRAARARRDGQWGARMRYASGNPHRAGLTGHLFGPTAPDLRRSRMPFAYWDSLMLDVGDFIRASGAGTAHVCWRSETGWVGLSWEWIGAQS